MVRESFRTVAAKLVWAVHLVVTVYFLVAWTLPWRWAMWSAVVGAPVMHLQWRLNDDVCVLTKLERYLRGADPTPRGSERSFIAATMERLAGRELPARCVNGVTYAVLWGGAAVAGLRLALR